MKQNRDMELTMRSTPEMPIRLFILDDHTLFREGLLRLIGSEASFEVLGHSGKPEEALAFLTHTPVDILILDYDLGGETALSFVETLRQTPFSGKVLLVTAGLPDKDALHLIKAGISGIFHKNKAPDDLLRSIHEVHSGHVLIGQEYFQTIVSAAQQSGADPQPLKDREKEIMRFLLQGLSNKEIGAQLNISESAVKSALQQLFAKTGVRTRSQLVRLAIEEYRDLL